MTRKAAGGLNRPPLKMAATKAPAIFKGKALNN